MKIFPRTLAPASRAFTLIEILVVLSIIAVLAALLTSAAGGVRASMQRTQCAANMRQIGIGLNLYCNDHSGDYPESMHTTEKEREAWVWLLKPYLGNVDEVRICPADPKAEERRKAKGTSYILNEYLVVPLTDPFGNVKESFTNRNRLNRPAQTIAAFIGADSLDVGLSADHTHSRNWKNWRRVLQDIQPDRHRSGAPNEDRTRGTANYLFADGHVETVEAIHVKERVTNQGSVLWARPRE